MSNILYSFSKYLLVLEFIFILNIFSDILLTISKIYYYII